MWCVVCGVCYHDHDSINVCRGNGVPVPEHAPGGNVHRESVGPARSRVQRGCRVVQKGSVGGGILSCAVSNLAANLW